MTWLKLPLYYVITFNIAFLHVPDFSTLNHFKNSTPLESGETDIYGYLPDLRCSALSG